jgi:hypothetical protein
MTKELESANFASALAKVHWCDYKAAIDPSDPFYMAVMIPTYVDNPDRRWWQFWKPRQVRSEAPGLYVTDDAGESWTLSSD